MPYIVYDKRYSQYIAKATRYGFSHTSDPDKAQVYRDRSGALNAVGEPDNSFEQMGKWPPSKKLKLPDYLDIRKAGVEEVEDDESDSDD